MMLVDCACFCLKSLDSSYWELNVIAQWGHLQYESRCLNCSLLTQTTATAIIYPLWASVWCCLYLDMPRIQPSLHCSWLHPSPLFSSKCKFPMHSHLGQGLIKCLNSFSLGTLSSTFHFQHHMFLVVNACSGAAVLWHGREQGVCHPWQFGCSQVPGAIVCSRLC